MDGTSLSFWEYIFSLLIICSLCAGSGVLIILIMNLAIRKGRGIDLDDLQDKIYLFRDGSGKNEDE